ncbi:Piso0_005464 [Millerozyma farinosa CBS 7064]|uniref:Piso0_005464 protein n=1 Tax=Pichia sorbitophila (strain ATCC MYA-4447 / BCRC 22081 / CBS 7064 / NBRC 10061 / NRRL Y-12695) TaxID=559304 RepID=G8Y561_PICSO|nr:Piso0_005464 [Millerozyma farinosa CBS 7064]
MTESLFDTKFTSEPSTANSDSSANNRMELDNGADAGVNHTSNPAADTGIDHDQNIGQTKVLPSINDNTNAGALINYRVLVSAKESGCLIGQNGAVIDSIRAETNTKAGISKLQPGSHERILTVSGTLDNSAKALSYFAQALCNARVANTLNYNYFPLKQLSPVPCIDEETTILRLLIPNAQMGTLIGSKGIRIQQIQSMYNISMIASKAFLQGSNERLVELQGTVDNLYDALRVISRCLIEDFSSIVGTHYYVPKGSSANNGNLNGLTRRDSSGSSRRYGNQNVSTTTLTFPNDVVGALIGKNGSRIQGVRKISGATITISNEVENQSDRVFTITGPSHAIEKAKSLLYHNLQRAKKISDDI